ncbi:unnamed protein product, partial [Oppiella nova]
MQENSTSSNQTTATSAAITATAKKSSSVVASQSSHTIPSQTLSVPTTGVTTAAVTASSATAVNPAAVLSAPAVAKGEQFSTSVASTTAQVITVVAPTHNTTAHGNNLIAGQPVVVQVSSGGQFIAVAVSPESAAQTTGGQQSGQYSLA